MKKLALFTLVFFVMINIKTFAQSPLGITNLGHPSLEFPSALALSNKNALTLTEDQKIWYSTSPLLITNPENIFIKSFLVGYHNETWEVFNSDSISQLPDTITTLSSNGSKLFIGSPSGFYTYDGNWNQLTLDLVNQYINAIFVNDDHMVFGTNEGVFIYENDAWQNFSTANSGLCQDTISCIEIAADGTYYFGTSNGLSVYNGDTWITLDTLNSNLIDNQITAIKSDPSGTIWIGTHSAGLFRYHQQEVESFYNITSYPTPSNMQIVSLAKDIDQTIFAPYGTKIVQIEGPDIYVLDINQSGGASVQLFAKEKLYLGNGQDLFEIDKSIVNYVPNINYLDINNVKAVFTATGRTAWEPSFFDYPVFNIPKDSEKTTVFSANIWVGGIDEDDSLCFAGEKYNQQGHDFWSGPVCNSQEAYESEKMKWSKVWKLTQDQIDYHRENWSNDDYVANPEILSWPANGNTALGQMTLIAPYIDVQGNGIYEPMYGDYPVIRGDQAIYFVYNDDRMTHTESAGNKLGIEVHGMAYAFNEPTSDALNNAVFVNYQIINRSDKVFSQTRIAKFADLDLGYAQDDYTGCDTSLNSFYVYNGTSIDGNGDPHAYGNYPPAQAITFLNQSMSAFVYYNNCSSGPTCDPQVSGEYYNYMRAIWRDNTRMLYGGNGHAAGQGTTGPETNFMFTGDPVTLEGWSEISQVNSPGDRRGLGSVYVGDFAPGDRFCLDLAYVFGQDPEGNNIGSVGQLKGNIIEVQAFYNQHFLGSCDDLIPTNLDESVYYNKTPKVFPNPVKSEITIWFEEQNQYDFYLYNSKGELLLNQQVNSELFQLNMDKFSNGVYVIQIISENRFFVERFLKID